jgi:hypothetical protein
MPRWIFDETCGSYEMLSQPISVTPPEITLRPATLGDGQEGRAQCPAKPFTGPETP